MLAQVLNVSVVDLEHARDLAIVQKDEERAEAFEPYFRVVICSSVRLKHSPAFMHITFYFCNCYPLVERLVLACEAYKAHFEKYQGKFFDGAKGEFLGAIFAPSYGHRYKIENDCKTVSMLDGNPSDMSITLSAKGSGPKF